jgi:hypothetical protein
VAGIFDLGLNGLADLMIAAEVQLIIPMLSNWSLGQTTAITNQNRGQLSLKRLLIRALGTLPSFRPEACVVVL